MNPVSIQDVRTYEKVQNRIKYVVKLLSDNFLNRRSQFSYCDIQGWEIFEGSINFKLIDEPDKGIIRHNSTSFPAIYLTMTDEEIKAAETPIFVKAVKEREAELQKERDREFAAAQYEIKRAQEVIERIKRQNAERNKND